MLKTYRELIHEECSKTDFTNEEDAVLLAQYLAIEAIRNHDITLIQEEKLKEIMTAKEFEEWATKIGEELFKKEIESMPQSAFKDFAIQNMDIILGAWE